VSTQFKLKKKEKKKKSIALGPKANKGNIHHTKEQLKIQNSNK